MPPTTPRPPLPVTSLLTPPQALNQEAKLNKQRNETELHQWIILHSPSDIAAINSARAKLRRLGLGPKWGRRIKDDRQPKRPMTSFANFTSSRWKSGDYEGLNVTEASKKASTEWKALSEAERAVCLPLSASWHQRLTYTTRPLPQRPRTEQHDPGVYIASRTD